MIYAEITKKPLSSCLMSKDSAMDELPIKVLFENALTVLGKPSLFFEGLKKENKLDTYFPELKALVNVAQHKEHHKEGDAWTHTMMVLDEAAKRRAAVKFPLGFMLSALCHDFGKAVCTENINGVFHAYKHETEGLPIIKGFLERLNYDIETMDYVLNMAELHMLPNTMAGARSKIKSTNKLFDKSVEPFDLIQLSVCDSLGKIPQESSEDFLIKRYHIFMETMSQPYVTESDLIDSGLIGSGDLGEVLDYAHKLRLAGCSKENSMKQCLSYAKKLLTKRK